MIPAERTAAVLLCAGLSRRFGSGNKLLAPLDGKPLLAHAADVIRSVPFARKIAVVGTDSAVETLLHGFELVRNPAPETGQDSSVRIGVAAAIADPVEGVLICLGDMPFVTRDLLLVLCECADKTTVAVSSTGKWNSPPLLLPRLVATEVVARADIRVRAILKEREVADVNPPRGTLRDFDTPADFA